MPVAKSYSHFTIEGEPFKENGRMYVNVIAPKGLKKVRWYNDTEYQRMYPEAKVDNNFNARYAFGFREDGFITLYKGNENKIREWATAAWPPRAWHNTLFNYFTPSIYKIEKLPEDIEAITLTWDEIKLDDTHMKSDEEVRAYVEKLTARTNSVESSKSEFQGNKNEWLQKAITIREKTTITNGYGEKHTYVMADSANNLYIWETGSKNYDIDLAVSLKMKVKDHKITNNKKYTVVWYCKEV